MRGLGGEVPVEYDPSYAEAAQQISGIRVYDIATDEHRPYLWSLERKSGPFGAEDLSVWQGHRRVCVLDIRARSWTEDQTAELSKLVNYMNERAMGVAEDRNELPRIYDIASDVHRPVTQADVDRLMSVASRYHILRQELLRLSKEHGLIPAPEEQREAQQTLTAATQAIRDAHR